MLIGNACFIVRSCGRADQFRASQFGGIGISIVSGNPLFICANRGQLECSGSDVGGYEFYCSYFTDSRGNSYVLAAVKIQATSLTSAIYYAKNIAAGSNTVTVTFNQAAAFPNINVLEYSGLDTASPLDVTASATSSGTREDRG